MVVLAIGRDSACSGVSTRPGDRVRCGSGYDTVYVDRKRDYDIDSDSDCETILTVIPPS